MMDYMLDWTVLKLYVYIGLPLYIPLCSSLCVLGFIPCFRLKNILSGEGGGGQNMLSGYVRSNIKGNGLHVKF